MADEAQAVKEEVVEQETTQADPASVESKEAPVEADPLDDVQFDGEESKETEAETDSEEAVQADDTATESETEETPAEEQPSKADERKQQLNTEIRDLVATRNTLRNEVTRLNSEVYQAQTPEELQAEGMDETRAILESMRQQQEIDKFNNQVAEAQLTLESESSRVLRDFPMFDPNSKEFKKDVASEAAEILQDNLIIDPNTGQPLGSHISPYKLYATLAKAAQASSVEGQIAGQRATEKMLASADSVGNAAPPKTKADPILEIWNDDSI